MPEFILDVGSVDGARAFNALDSFTQGYLEAAFFTSTGNAEDDELKCASVADLAPEALAAATVDCAKWQAENAALLALAYERDDYSEEQAGRDFWYTRNGHGVGFWDRKQLESDSAEYEALTAEMIANRDNNAAWARALAKRNLISAGSLGERLSDAAQKAGARDMYRGDDESIYFA